MIKKETVIVGRPPNFIFPLSLSSQTTIGTMIDLDSTPKPNDRYNYRVLSFPLTLKFLRCPCVKIVVFEISNKK